MAAWVAAVSPIVAGIAKGGRVIAVNEAWAQFGRANGADPEAIGIGADYRSLCRRAAAQGDRDAQAALRGLDSVLAGNRESFVWAETFVRCLAQEHQEQEGALKGLIRRAKKAGA